MDAEELLAGRCLRQGYGYAMEERLFEAAEEVRAACSRTLLCAKTLGIIRDHHASI